MSFSTRTPRILFLDSGLGGLTVIRAVRHAVPEADVHFLADDACFPYGTKSEASLIARLTVLLEAAFQVTMPEALVLACNTASTVALAPLRERFALPIVGTVPAIKPAAALTRTGLVSVLATPGTVAREYTKRLIEAFGGGARFTLIGAPALAGLAEAYASGAGASDAAILGEIASCFVECGAARTDVVVLACTHYPLLLDRLEALAHWPVTWLDPAPAIARRVANILAEKGYVVGVGAKPGTGSFRFTSGKKASPALAALLKAHNLENAAGDTAAFAA